MPLLTIAVAPTGERAIIAQDGPRSTHLGLFNAAVQASPSDCAGVELWDSNGGRIRSRALKPGKDAPSLEAVIQDCEKAALAQEKKVKAARKADIEAAEAPARAEAAAKAADEKAKAEAEAAAKAAKKAAKKASKPAE